MALGNAPAEGIEQPVPAGPEHTLEPAVAQQEGALALLHRQAQHQLPQHDTSPSLAARRRREAVLRYRGRGCRTRLPVRYGGVRVVALAWTGARGVGFTSARRGVVKGPRIPKAGFDGV